MTRKIKSRMVSGIKPSGTLTLGNYLGAIKQFIKYQDSYDLFIFIADLHAITTYQNPISLKKNIIELLAIYLAAGLNPEKCTIFQQSKIAAHNKLEWILTCNTKVSELTKMPQYKNFLENHSKAIPDSILQYPNLMSSDILLYDAEYVPVGLDQVSHIYLTKLQAETFNKRFGSIFVLPKPLLTNYGAKIMSLSDPTKKMSKSESDTGTIFLTDTEETIRLKIKKALTDSENKVYYDPNKKPGISNLMVIYSCLTNKTLEDIEETFKEALDYRPFKKAVADAIVNELTMLQKKILEIKQVYNLQTILSLGNSKARRIANKKILKVYKKVGLI